MGVRTGYYPPRKELPPHDRSAPCAEDGVPVPTTGNSLAGVLSFSGAGWWSIGSGIVPLTSEQKCNIIEQYKLGVRNHTLAKAYNVNRWSITDVIKESGESYHVRYKDRVHKVNEEFFHSLTEKSKYVIGFLMADGCVHKGSININISLQDRGVLDQVKGVMGYDGPIKDVMGGTYAPKMYVRLSIHSKKLCDKLHEFGVTERKSLTARASSTLELDKDFWRGVVDGDGSVGINNRGYPFLELAGSLDLMTQFKNFCSYTASECKVNVVPFKSIYRVRTMGSHAKCVIDTMYENNAISLPRKSAMAERIMDL